MNTSDRSAMRRATEAVLELWMAFDRREFDDVACLLHDDFVATWPQSRERIRGRDNFIALNKNYPGCWGVVVDRIHAFDDQVISEITLSDGRQTLYAVSVFTMDEGRIRAVREYFADTYDPPDWRRQWVERID